MILVQKLTDRFNSFYIPGSFQEKTSQNNKYDEHDKRWDQQPIIYYRNDGDDSSKFKEELKKNFNFLKFTFAFERLEDSSDL